MDTQFSFMKRELLIEADNNYLCHRLNSLIRPIQNTGRDKFAIVDEYAVCMFMVGLLAREMRVTTYELLCERVCPMLRASRGFFAYINASAAKFIKENYGCWIYYHDYEEVVTSSDYTPGCDFGTGDRSKFLNRLIQKNMRDDEKLIVTFRKDS